MNEWVLVEEQGPVCEVWLNRPEKMNPTNYDVLNGLSNAFAQASENPDIRVVVLRGKGQRAFSAGADLDGYPWDQPDEIYESVRPFVDVLLGMRQCKKPIINVVQGYAIGGGCVLTAASDFSIASEKATFSIPEFLIGTGVYLQPIIECVGRKRAFDMLLTNRRIKAEEALHMGLVNRVVAHEQLEAEVQETIDLFLHNAPKAVSESLPALRKSLSMEYDSSILYIHEVVSRLMANKEMKEGVKALQAKEKPPWYVG